MLSKYVKSFILINLMLGMPVLAVEDFAWIELGPEGPLLRVVSEGDDCPKVALDGTSRPTLPRVTTSPEGFPVKVCELKIPPSTRSVVVNGQSLPIPKKDPQTIVVLGDTGCRIKNDDVQNCNGQGEGPKWQFDKIAASAAAMNPDLVIHVGDYLYREYPCPKGNKGCEGSPYGDNWPTWRVDFFHPARPLLAAAPWLFVRGNHENCDRSWKGWFLFLDPMKVSNETFEDCPDHPGPYKVGLGSESVIVMDTSHIPEDYSSTPDEATVETFQKQFDEVNAMASGSSWTATHRPFWAVSSYTDSDGNTALSAMDLTLQTAIAGSKGGELNRNIKMSLAGHIHQFEHLTFEDGRPTQIVAGAGGTKLDPPFTPELIKANTSIFKDLKLKLSNFQAFDNFNFMVIRIKPQSWEMSLHDIEGKVEASYSLPR